MAFFHNPTAVYPNRIKFDAKSGRMYRCDRVKGADGKFSTNDVDITSTATMIMDPTSIRQGWFNVKTYKEIMVGYNDPDPGHPAEVDDNGASLWKFQVKITCKLCKQAGGDVREFATLAGTTIASLSELIEQWDTEQTNADDHQRQLLPVVRLTGAKPIKGAHGTNFSAEWETIQWMERPADLVPAANGNGSANGNGNGKPAPSNGHSVTATVEFDAPATEFAADAAGDAADDGLPF